MSLVSSPFFLRNFSLREMKGETKHFYQFESFRLDVKERQLLCDGSPIPLAPKAFEVLVALVERNNRLVEKDELMKIVWADLFVEEANIARIVHTLRKVLGENENGNKFIETVPKRGYRFVTEVSESREMNAPELTDGNGHFAVIAEKSFAAVGELSPSPRQSKFAKKFVVFAVTAVIAATLLTSLWFYNRPSRIEAARRGTNSEEAYQLYLQGSALTDKRTLTDAVKAVEYLEQAVALDPNYALAFARLGDAHGVIGQSGGDKTASYLKQRIAVEKALSLDANLAEAYSQLGEIKMNFEWDFAAAERAHRRAVELAPASPVAHREFSIYLNSMGRFDEAVVEIKTAIDLEPAAVLNQRIYGMILYYARRYDEAVVQLRRAVEREPNIRGGYGLLVKAYKMKGDEDQAFECFLQSLRAKNEYPEKVDEWQKIYARSGWRGVYQKQIALADEKNSKLSDWDLANIYGELGDTESALARIEKALPNRGWGWTILKINPSLDSLRSDSRFAEIIKRVGLK